MGHCVDLVPPYPYGLREMAGAGSQTVGAIVCGEGEWRAAGSSAPPHERSTLTRTG